MKTDYFIFSVFAFSILFFFLFLPALILSLNKPVFTLDSIVKQIVARTPKSNYIINIFEIHAVDFQNQIRAVAFRRSLKTRLKIAGENLFGDIYGG